MEEPRRGPGDLSRVADVIGHLLPNNTGKVSKSEVIQTYECLVCRDAHFVHPLGDNGKPDYSRVVPCGCYKERLEMERRRRMLEMCELPAGAEHMTFAEFRVMPGLKEAYESALALAEEKAESNWLTLMSDVDRGKTHLVVAICNHWVRRGKPARYAYVPLLLDELRRGFQQVGDSSYKRRFDFFLNVPLLALDDLGAEYRTDWVQERLDTIIDYRLMHELPLVVSTNLAMDQLNFRIASRLRRHGKVVFINTPEYRLRR